MKIFHNKLLTILVLAGVAYSINSTSLHAAQKRRRSLFSWVGNLFGYNDQEAKAPAEPPAHRPLPPAPVNGPDEGFQ